MFSVTSFANPGLVGLLLSTWLLAGCDPAYENYLVEEVEFALIQFELDAVLGVGAGHGQMRVRNAETHEDTAYYINDFSVDLGPQLGLSECGSFWPPEIRQRPDSAPPMRFHDLFGTYGQFDAHIVPIIGLKYINLMNRHNVVMDLGLLCFGWDLGLGLGVVQMLPGRVIDPADIDPYESEAE